jgi:hypothetical protein
MMTTGAQKRSAAARSNLLNEAGILERGIQLFGAVALLLQHCGSSEQLMEGHVL